MIMKKMNKRGVTLIELVVVFAIIAIGTVLVVPNIGAWLPNYRLRSATREITSTLRTAQMKAVSNNIEYGVAFNTGSQQYQLYRSSGGLVTDGPLTDLPAGIQFNSVTFAADGTLGLPFARFLPNSSSNGGRVILRNTKGNQRQITVLLSTGRITTQ
jgi:type IV fimbrial biogenesis protein FimT